MSAMTTKPTRELMNTHSHNFRCDDGLWAGAKVAAAVEGRTVTDVLVAALRRLVVAPQPAARRLPDVGAQVTHPDAWAHRQAVVTAQQSWALHWPPDDEASFEHMRTLLHAAVTSSGDVPALLDTISITDLQLEIAQRRQ